MFVVDPVPENSNEMAHVDFLEVVVPFLRETIRRETPRRPVGVNVHVQEPALLETLRYVRLPNARRPDDEQDGFHISSTPCLANACDHQRRIGHFDERGRLVQRKLNGLSQEPLPQITSEPVEIEISNGFSDSQARQVARYCCPVVRINFVALENCCRN